LSDPTTTTATTTITASLRMQKILSPRRHTDKSTKYIALLLFVVAVVVKKQL